MINPILKRHSVRQYQSIPVEKEDLDALVAVINASPAAMEQFEVVQVMIVQDKTVLDQIETATDHLAYDAPLLFVITTKKGSPFGARDASVMAENLMVEATSRSLGSVYVLGGAMKLNENRELLTQLGVPADFEVSVIVPVGHPKTPLTQAPEEGREKRFKIIYK